MCSRTWIVKSLAGIFLFMIMAVGFGFLQAALKDFFNELQNDSRRSAQTVEYTPEMSSRSAATYEPNASEPLVVYMCDSATYFTDLWDQIVNGAVDVNTLTFPEEKHQRCGDVLYATEYGSPLQIVDCVDVSASDGTAYVVEKLQLEFATPIFKEPSPAMIFYYEPQGSCLSQNYHLSSETAS